MPLDILAIVSPDALQTGGVIVLALGLLEIVKVYASRRNGKATSDEERRRYTEMSMQAVLAQDQRRKILDKIASAQETMAETLSKLEEHHRLFSEKGCPNATEIEELVHGANQLIQESKSRGRRP